MYLVGYRRIAQSGLLVFTLASLGCAFAPSLPTLSLARVIQGLGAAGIMSVSPALVRFTYPQRHLGRALGIITFVPAWHGSGVSKDETAPSVYGGTPAGLVIAIRGGPTILAGLSCRERDPRAIRR